MSEEAWDRFSLSVGICPGCTATLPECEPCGSTGREVDVVLGTNYSCEICDGYVTCTDCGAEWYR